MRAREYATVPAVEKKVLEQIRLVREDGQWQLNAMDSMTKRGMKQFALRVRAEAAVRGLGLWVVF